MKIYNTVIKVNNQVQTTLNTVKWCVDNYSIKVKDQSIRNNYNYHNEYNC